MRACLIQSIPWEESSAELSLDEELSIETSRSGVEGCAWDRRVDEIGGGDRVTVRDGYE